MKNHPHSEHRYLSLVNGEYRVHDTMQEAREYELQHLGYTSWSANRRRFRISLPAALFKGIVSAIVVQSGIFTLIALVFLFTFVSCAPVKGYNHPPTMKQHQKQVQHIGRLNR